MAASIYLMKAGTVTISTISETSAHCACAAVFLGVLVPFGFILEHEWTAVDDRELYLTELETKQDPAASPEEIDAAKASNAEALVNYSRVISIMARIWLGLFCVAVGLWVYMRFVVLRRLEREWKAAFKDAGGTGTDNVDWIKASVGQEAKLTTKQKILVPHRQAFIDVVRPLEPYVFVFLLFLPPAVTLATTWCDEHSNTESVCAAPCELVLAFRSIGSSLVYLTRPGVGGQLADWRKLLSKAAARFRHQTRCGGKRRAGDSANRVLFDESANQAEAEAEVGLGEGMAYQLMVDDGEDSDPREGRVNTNVVPNLSQTSTVSTRLRVVMAVCLFFLIGMAIYLAVPTRTNTNPGDYANCPAYVLTNRFGNATIVVGGIGFVAAMLVVLVIFAYRKDRGAMRERIILGLTLSSAVYSAMCMAPLQAFNPDCTHIASASDLALVRIWWFAAKFAVVGYEIFILAASVFLLKTGKVALSTSAEVSAHCAIVAIFLGISTFAGIAYRNLVLAFETATAQLQELEANQTLNASSTSIDAARHHQETTQRAYALFLSTLARAWLGLFAVALGMWVYMQFGVLRSFERQWDDEYVTAAGDWARNHWSAADKPVVALKKRLLALQKIVVTEVIGPLEPYVFVFLVFLPPTILMATDWCEVRSGATGSCFSACELTLAFRSIGSSLVYLTRPGVGAQLGDWRKMLSKASARIRGQVHRGGVRRAGDSANRVLIAEDANEIRRFEVEDEFL